MAIEYVSDELTKAIYNELKTTWKKERVGEYLKSVVDDGFQDTVIKLIDLGIATEGAKALATWLGRGTTCLSAVMIAKDINDFLKEEKYKIASNNGDGLLHAQFNTSYQGAWYGQTLADYWTKSPTAYEPKSIYATGRYVSYSVY